ncbi:MAG: phage tail protein [Paucimonas sp.]|nr:phage tail protein [Paucimonas sp.]
MARITIAGESLIAQKQGAKEVLQISRFIYANVPGLDPSAPIDRAAGKPPASQIVHTYDIPPGNSGYVNPNQVVYSSMLGSDIGDFDWNWLGLESAEGVLFAVAYLPLQQKRRNNPPLQIGNNVTRNILVEYSGAQELTGITIDASTWQHDFTVRLKGIDERERLSNRDVYGRACFFGNGLQFQKVGSAYQLAAGVAYLEGIRLELPKVQPLSAPSGATKVWLSVTMRRELNDLVPSWSVAYLADQQDYKTPDGWVYCFQLAEISSAGVISDSRKAEPIDGPLVKHFASRKSVTDLEDGTTPAGKARQLAEARQIALQGDVTGRVQFDGSQDVTIQATLADIGVVPGTYSKVSINAKGLVVGSQALQQADIPHLDWGKITSGKPTTLAGYGITDALRSGYSNQQPNFFSDSIGTDYRNAAITVREAGLALDRNRDWSYAPRIGFHWGTVTAGDLGMTAQGILCWNGNPLYHTGNLNPATIVPAGTKVESFSRTPPPGTLRCNGAAVSRATFAALFAAIGTQYGAGDGVNTFNLPDTRGMFFRDVDDGRGYDPNRIPGTLQDSQNKYHDHAASTSEAGWHYHPGSRTEVAGSHSHTFNYTNTPTRDDAPGIGAAMHYTAIGWTAGDRINAAGDHTHVLTILGDGVHSHAVTVAGSGGVEARPVNMALYCYIKY